MTKLCEVCEQPIRTSAAHPAHRSCRQIAKDMQAEQMLPPAPITKNVICDACGGSGWDNGTCEGCEGTGVMVQIVRAAAAREGSAA